MTTPTRRVLRWDPYLEPNEDDMQFRLTYEGQLLAHRDDKRLSERSLHVHTIRKEFHKQLAVLWDQHPVLKKQRYAQSGVIGAQPIQAFKHDGFNWLPLATEDNGLICSLDILMLRSPTADGVLQDVDNRLKTIFDALRKAKGPNELGANTQSGIQGAATGETPFYVLLEDDRLITHLSVTTDILLEPVPNIVPGDAVRLVVGVTIRPYDVHMDNLAFA